MFLYYQWPVEGEVVEQLSAIADDLCEKTMTFREIDSNWSTHILGVLNDLFSGIRLKFTLIK